MSDIQGLQKQVRTLRTGMVFLTLILGGAIIFVLFFNMKKNVPEVNAATNPTVVTVTDTVKTDDIRVSHSIPSGISFAGEMVPLSDFEVRERVDYELVSSIYRHSMTYIAMKRANRCFPVIEKILAKNGVPDDFKYLCVVESNLTNAVSPAKAVGYWQFLSETGKQYGLEVSEEVDERYHLEKSTQAACEYLKKAYQKFGSWTAAAASYNMGMAGLNGDMTDQKSNTYYDLRLNSETSRYIPRIIATKIIFENPRQYGYMVSQDDIYPEIPVKTISVNTPVENFVDWAAANGTNYKLLRELNPWLRKMSLKNARVKEYKILLPGNGWNNYEELQKQSKNIWK